MMSPKEIGNRLGMSTEELARLLGVAPSTVYRWEQQKKTNTRIDPHQREILGALENLIDRGSSTDLAGEIRQALMSGGTLYGLHIVLTKLYEKPDRS